MVRALPLTDPVGVAVFWAVFAVFGVAELVITIRSRSSAAASHDRGSYWLLVASIVIAIYAAFGFAAALPGAAIATSSPGRWILFGVGVALMAGGVALRVWSVTVLGRFFTVTVRVAAGQGVVDWGPYRLVRHPAYLGSLITFIGIGLALDNWASLAVIVLLPLAATLRRIRVEEQVLTEQLGDPYRRYAAAHSRLVPKVW